jgi:glutathione peroxidase
MPNSAAAASLYEIPVTTWDQQATTLERFRGQVLLIVNVASRCGFTRQYAGLEATYRKHSDRGFTVLAFPCNQFGHQEPGTIDEIQTFCREQYDVTFPLFDKIDVNGPRAHPLFVFLKGHAPGWLGMKAIRWNFTKFLVDRSGRVVARFASSTSVESLDARIEALLEPGR